jgi:NADH dehydrogenase
MANDERHVVTGAFGYTGKYIARRLLAAGKQVTTLTGHPNRHNPFAHSIDVARLAFDNPAELTASLRGATTLYNTYWVRFDHGRTTFAKAVENTRTLFAAARAAGVRRIVHVSITNPAKNASLPYFRGKAELERALADTGVSYAIIRPTVIFGTEDILINNIAWLLRRLPVFAIAGSGNYRLQPVFVEDMAEIAVNAAASSENIVIDAVGPELFTFEELVRLIAEKLQISRPIVHVSPRFALFVGRLLGGVVGDVVLTDDELKGLMANLLVSNRPPTGRTRLSTWLDQNVATLGIEYTSELDRHYR